MVFFFYIWKSTFISSTFRYFESTVLLNTATSELCLLFTDLRALRATGEGWEGGIYANAYFRIRIWLENLSDRTLPLYQLNPFSSVCAPSTKANSSLVVYFVSNLPPPSHQPLHTLGKVRFDYDCLMTAVLLPCLKRVKILHPRGKFRAADHVCFKVPFLSVDRGRSERFPVKYTCHHVAVLWNLKCSLPNMFAESWRKFKAQDKTQCTNRRKPCTDFVPSHLLCDVD